MLLGTYWAIFGVGVYGEKFFEVYVYRLTTFVFYVLLYSCSFISDFFNFYLFSGIILRLFGTYQAIFGAGVEPEKFFGLTH